jgi:hypothetical protein
LTLSSRTTTDASEDLGICATACSAMRRCRRDERHAVKAAASPVSQDAQRSAQHIHQVGRPVRPRRHAQVKAQAARHQLGSRSMLGAASARRGRQVVASAAHRCPVGEHCNDWGCAGYCTGPPAVRSTDHGKKEVACQSQATLPIRTLERMRSVVRSCGARLHSQQLAKPLILHRLPTQPSMPSMKRSDLTQRLVAPRFVWFRHVTRPIFRLAAPP